MARPLVVTIPHELGKAEAIRRLKTGLGRVRTTFGDRMLVLDEAWMGDHMQFRVAVLGQEASGTIDVADHEVRLEVLLPWVLAVLGEKAKALLTRQGRLMLEKK